SKSISSTSCPRSSSLMTALIKPASLVTRPPFAVLVTCSNINSTERCAGSSLAATGLLKITLFARWYWPPAISFGVKFKLITLHLVYYKQFCIIPFPKQSFTTHRGLVFLSCMGGGHYPQCSTIVSVRQVVVFLHTLTLHFYQLIVWGKRIWLCINADIHA